MERIEIRINKSLLNGFFEDFGSPIKSDCYKVPEEFYKRFEARLTQSHEEFLALLGKRTTIVEEGIKPKEYTFNKEHLDNIVFICYKLKIVLDHIWGDYFIGEIDADRKNAQREYTNMKEFLEAKKHGLWDKKCKIVIDIGGEKLIMTSSTMMWIVTKFLNEMEKNVKDFPEFAEYINVIFSGDPSIFDEIGQGKNSDRKETQKLTQKLFLFLKDNKIIKGEEIPLSMYHQCIADLYSLMEIPPMLFGKSITSWDYLADEKKYFVKRGEKNGRKKFPDKIIGSYAHNVKIEEVVGMYDKKEQIYEVQGQYDKSDQVKMIAQWINLYG